MEAQRQGKEEAYSVLFWFFSPKVSNKVNKSTGNLKLLLD
jgi:hypothetical protein